MNRFFHGEYGAARPRFFLRVFLVLLGFDAFGLMLRRGARYGLTSFHVAHFEWMNWLPWAPTRGAYVAIILLSGLLALTLAVTALHRGALLVLFLLYTSGWSMSMMDGYQHHYFLSLVLFCLIGFPRGDSPREAPGTGPLLTHGWGYPLLGVTVAFLYLFTAITKLDQAWRAGEILPAIGGAERAFGWLARHASTLGIETHRFWAWISAGVVAQELLISACYIAAIHRDQPGGRVRRIFCGMGLVATVGLHVTAEIMGLRIGLFSYYMLALSASFLLPLPALEWVTATVTRLLQAMRRIIPIPRPQIAVFASLPALRSGGTPAILLLLGWRLDLPGALVACVVASAALVLVSTWTHVRGEAGRSNPWSGAALFAVLGMWLVVTATPVRFDFYRALGTELAQLQRPQEALVAYQKAEVYAPAGRTVREAIRRLGGT